MPPAEERDEKLQCDAWRRQVESLSHASCGSDNPEFGDTDVRCLEDHCVTTEVASEVHIGRFELTSPTERPGWEAIRIRPVQVMAADTRKRGAA